jgi:hypothetical protein
MIRDRFARVILVVNPGKKVDRWALDFPVRKVTEKMRVADYPNFRMWLRTK